MESHDHWYHTWLVVDPSFKSRPIQLLNTTRPDPIQYIALSALYGNIHCFATGLLDTNTLAKPSTLAVNQLPSDDNLV